MVNLQKLQADVHALHEAIDQEDSLLEIRIATLRALTRHRFFSEEMLRATGDWEPRMQSEEWARKTDCIQKKDAESFMASSQSLDRHFFLKVFGQHGAPQLSEDVRQRAAQPLGQYLKHVVHRIALVCVRNREEAAGENYQREMRRYKKEVDAHAQKPSVKLTPEDREKLMRLVRDRQERAEPGDDWVSTDEIVSSDAAFEADRRRLLRESGNDLQLYTMILERRLKMGETYSGLDLINSGETTLWPNDKPDWEPDEERELLITKLEALTGTSFLGTP